MLAKRLAMKLKQLRTRQGFNQTDLAKKVRVTQAYIAMLENGRENPTLNVLERLAKALKVSVAELVQ
jgi:transcriptional regulator with XRE-family HTH domain